MVRIHMHDMFDISTYEQRSMEIGNEFSVALLY